MKYPTVPERRAENLKQLSELARIFNDSGQILITHIAGLDPGELEKMRHLTRPETLKVFDGKKLIQPTVTDGVAKLKVLLYHEAVLTKIS